MSVSNTNAYNDNAPQTLEYVLAGGTLSITVSYKFHMGAEAGDYEYDFTNATNAGVYNVKATITGTENYDGFEETALLVINKLTFTAGVIADGNLGEIFFVGNVRSYDMSAHYIAVSYTNAYLDSVVNSLSYTLPNESSLVIPITYTYYKGLSGEYSNEFISATNAGTYNIKAKIADNINYDGFEQTAILQINKLTFTAESLGELYFVGDTRPYDGYTHYMSVSRTDNTYVDLPPETLSYELSGGILDIEVSYTYYLGSGAGVYDQTFTSAINAGIYNVKAYVAGTENYDGYEETATLVINKLTFTSGTIEDGHLGEIYFVGNTMQYDMGTHYVAVSYTNAWQDSPRTSLSYTLPSLAQLIIPISYTYYLGSEAGEYSNEFISAKDANIYNVKAYIAENMNYQGFEQTAVLEIEKLSFTEGSLGVLNFVGDTRPYDGYTHYMSVSKTSTEYVDLAPTDLVYSLTHGTLTITVDYTYCMGSVITEYDQDFVSATNAGIYNVKASILGTANYEGGDYYATLTINKLSFTDGVIADGHLGSLYFVGNVMPYDMGIHYVSVSYVNAWQDSITRSLSYTLPNGNALNIPIAYTYYMGEGGGSYSEEFIQAYDAGIYNIKAKINEDINYQGFDQNVVLEIEKLTFEADSLGELFFVGDVRPYDGYTHYMSLGSENAFTDTAPVDLVYTLTYGTLTIEVEYTYYLGSEPSAYSLTFTNATNAGIYNVKATIANNTNYEGRDYYAVLQINKLVFQNGTESDIDVANGYLGQLYFVGNHRTYDMGTHYVAVSYENAWQDSPKASFSYTLPNGSPLVIPVSYTYYLGESGSSYDLEFISATDAGRYNIKATIEETLNYEGFEQAVVLEIDKLTFTEGSLGEIYFVGNDRLYDSKTHYMSISKIDATYYDVPPEDLVYSLAYGDLIIEVAYTYYMGSTPLPFEDEFTSATDAGIYNVKAYFAGTVNYDGFESVQILHIRKLQWTDVAGHLGSLYLTGTTRYYDATYHYAGVSRTDNN
ncbi:MAG: hypothetical protein EOM87_06735, partial [Clostridia bacterium]|nr:hypothetical protein [Clostridia bacterium]